MKVHLQPQPIPPLIYMSEPHIWTPGNLPSIITVPEFAGLCTGVRILRPSPEQVRQDFTEDTADSPRAGEGIMERWLTLPSCSAVPTHVHQNLSKRYSLVFGSTQRGGCLVTVAIYQQNKWRVYSLNGSNPILWIPVNAPHAILRAIGVEDSATYRLNVLTFGNPASPPVWEKATAEELAAWRPPAIGV